MSNLNVWGRCLGILISVLLLSETGRAQIQLNPSFAPADASRSWMDVGGVWNGSTEVTATTGDAFGLEIRNGSTTSTAQDFALTVTLPAGFAYVAGSVTGIAGVTASQLNNTVTVSFPAGTTIAPLGTANLALGLTTTGGVAIQQHDVEFAFSWAETPGGALTTRQATQQVQVLAGATTVLKAPNTQLRAINGTATWEVTVKNTGLGGLFAVTIDETALGTSTSLVLTGMIQSKPASPAATGVRPVLTLPYLKVGEEYVVQVTATVVGCKDITNTVATTDRTGTTAKTGTATVTLDLTVPLIEITPPSVTLNYATAVAVTVPVRNLGMGDAVGLKLLANYASKGLTVTNVTGGWAYAAGVFSYTANGGSLGSGLPANLSFHLQDTTPCDGFSTGTVVWGSDYQNSCGDRYQTPTELHSVGAPTSLPVIELKKEAPERLEVGEAGTWELKIEASNLQHIQTDPLRIQDVLPAGISNVSIGVAPPGTTVDCPNCGPGATLTWSIPKAALTGELVLQIQFTAPQDPCLGGKPLTNRATVAATSTAGCDVSTAAVGSSLLINNPGQAVQQTFNVNVPMDGVFETGTADGGNGTRDPGEGEFIPFTGQFAFPAAPFAGAWDQSKFSDDFGGKATQTLVPNSVRIAIDGGAEVAVPTAAIAAVPGSLVVSLDFMAGAGYANDPNVAGHRFVLTYSTTVADADLPVGKASGMFLQLATLELAGGGSGCTQTGSKFTLGDYVNIARGAAQLQVRVPESIAICVPFEVTYTVSNGTKEKPSNLLLKIPTSGDYDFVVGQTPIYGGMFQGSNIVFDPKGGVNPTFALSPAGAELASEGTIKVMMVRRATTSTTPTAVTGSIGYDDHQTAPAGTRFFNSTAQDRPVVILAADLQLQVTPQEIAVVGDTVRWRVYATNGGSGSTTESSLTIELPAGLTPDETATNALNTVPVVVSGNTMTWAGGAHAPATTKVFEVVATVAGSTCSIPNGSVATRMTWGCGGLVHQTTQASEPNFTFPSGAMTVAHVAASFGQLCANGTIEILVRNTGTPAIEDLTLQETLTPLVTGLSLVAGSVQFKRNTDANWIAAGDPTGSGAPYVWTKAEIPALALLESATAPGAASEIRVRFSVMSTELTNGANRTITASTSGTTACSGTALGAGVPFELPLRRPVVNVATQGRNVTAGQATYVDEVFGGTGDQVEWRIQVSNSGEDTAQHLRLTEILAASGAVSGTLTGPGHAGTVVADGATVSLPDLGIGQTITYTLAVTLGATCVDGTHVSQASWGCASNGANAASNLTTPGNSRSTAALRMLPGFSGDGITQTFSPLSAGRSVVQIVIANRGGRVQNMVLTDTLPTNVIRTVGFVPTVTSTGSVTGITLGGTVSQPQFTLLGTLRNGETATITMQVEPAAGFDLATGAFVNPETVANGLDPTPVAAGANVLDLVYESSCGNGGNQNHSATLDLATPDLDVAVSPTSVVVTSGASYSFDLTIRNDGDLGSIADGIDVTTALGGGWSSVVVEVITAGTGGSTGVCAGGNCLPAMLGSLGRGQTALVRVTAQANDNGFPLSVLTQVEGSMPAATTNYSLDQAQVQIIGFAAAMTLQSTSESFTANADLAIGEEATWLLRARMFGGSALSAIKVRNTLPTGLGFVRFTPTGNHTVTVSGMTGGTPVQSGVLNFDVASLPGGSGTFEVTVETRALNVGTNTQGLTLAQNLGVSLLADFGGGTTQTYASDHPTDGFGGSEPNLHANASATVRLPNLAFDKQVRNVTANTAFGQVGTAQAGDVLEYRITITNNGVATAWDLVVPDVLGSSKLLLQDGASDLIDNDGDGLVDAADVGGEGLFAAGAGGTVTFNHGNTGLTAGSSLAQLDAAGTITLTYRVTLANNVNPSEVLANAASYASSSLPGPQGSQTAPLGTPGNADGERQWTGNDVANTTVVAVTLAKSIQTTSAATGAAADVFVGEQVRFELKVTLPAGEVPALAITDALPEGLRLLQTPAVTLGAAVAGAQPTITPGTLPAQGSPLQITWDFGTRLVSTGDANARTIKITYLTQVENTSGNQLGAELSNEASYQFTGSGANSRAVTLTVREAAATLAQTVTPTARPDAGQVLTYRVVLRNTGLVPSYDFDLVAALPAGVVYVDNSTQVVTGPSLGEPTKSSGQLLWGRSQTVPQNVDLNSAGRLEFTYQVRVLDSAEPDELLRNTLRADWTSLDGSPGPNLGVAVGAAGTASGERTGTGGGVNDLSVQVVTDLTVANDFAVSVAATGDTVTAGGFRVGDLVTYTLRATLQEGTVDSFRIEDTLPSGLAFHDFQALSPSSGNAGFVFTPPTGANAPALGATGTVLWQLGRVVNAGDNITSNDVLTLVYRARVLDTGGIAAAPTTRALTNRAVLRYEDALANAESVGPDDASVSVKQPLGTVSIARASGQSAMAGSADKVRFTVTARNTGDAPAYNGIVRVTLPVGMRAALPTTITATLNGSSVTLQPLAYVPATGVITWQLTDAQAWAASGTLEVTLEATLDVGVGGGLSLAASSALPAYFSQPGSAPTERRQYAAVAGNSAAVTTPSPDDLDKVRNLAILNPGDTVTFTLKVPATTVDVALYDVRLLDDVDVRLRVLAVNHNGAALGTTVTNGGSAAEVDLVFGTIPANAQAEVVVTAVLENQSGTTSGQQVFNQASYTWAQTTGGGAQPQILSSRVHSTVTEPDLVIDQVFKSWSLQDPARGLQSGDSVTFTVTVTNNGTGPAYDFVLRNVIDQDLINPSVTAAPDSPGQPTGSTAGTNTVTHTWSPVAGPLAASGGTYQFDLTFKVAATIEPFENLVSTASVDWNSASAPNVDRRGPVDGYSATDASPVTVTSGNVSMTKTEVGGDSRYAIGEEISYRLRATFGEGKVTMLHLLDTLPQGLEFVRSTLTPTNVQRVGGGAVTLVSGPVTGATGDLDFSLGDIESVAANPSIEVLVVARVQDVPGNQQNTELTNRARTTLESPAGSGMMREIVAQANVQITVVEPRLVLALDGPTEIELGRPETLTARIENLGDAAAYQPVVIVQYPEGLRDTDPTTLPLTVQVLGGRIMTLVSGTDYVLSWNATTGQLQISLVSVAGYLSAGERLNLDLQAALDPTATDLASFEWTGTATSYHSLDQSSGPAAGSRLVTTVLGSGTTGTASGSQGDDAVDNHVLTGKRPVLTIRKGADRSAAEPSETLTYTLIVTNTGSVGAASMTLTDVLGPSFEPNTLRDVLITPSGGNLTVDGVGGTNGTGLLTLGDLSIASAGTLTIEFKVDLAAVIPSGTVVQNQGLLTAPNFPAPFLSDSDRPEDNDGLETGNDASDPNDDDPTRTTIGSMPVLDVQKRVTDDNGLPLAAGETLTYTISITNEGNEAATAATLTDAIPANTTYVLGSTTLNGAPVPDVGGGSPLITGTPVSSPGAASGALAVGQPAVVSFQVRVDASVGQNTVVANQAWVRCRGEGSGTLVAEPSDDPETSVDDDATQIVVGNDPLIDAAKVVIDENGAPLLPGEALTYSISIANLGGAPSEDVTLTDPIPVGTVYLPGSLVFDPDGSGPAASITLSDAVDGDSGDFGGTLANAVTVHVGPIAAGQNAVVTFRVTVDPGLSLGTRIRNQGRIQVPGQPDEWTDADGNEANGDQPTDLTVGDLPALSLVKSVIDLNGGTLDPGDTIRFALRLRNTGNQSAIGVTLVDAVPPAPTTYVAGSTRLDGVVVADGGGGASALGGGLAVGTLAPQQEVLVEVDVRIPAGVNLGTRIDNQASFSADGGLSGSSNAVTLNVGGAPGSASLRGSAWLDLDHSRTQEPGEPGQPGWTVEILLNGVVVQSTLTDAQGIYQFSGLRPGGGYELRFRHPAGAAYGGAVSNEPGVILDRGTISNLTLSSGSLILGQSLPIDPSGVVYDAVTRQPISGVLAEFVGPPGFDPSIHLMPGQFNQVTGADGRYRFDVMPGAPTGSFRLSFRPPAGYLPTFPSTIIVPEPGELDPTGAGDPLQVAPNYGAPQSGEPTLYYLEFNLAPGDPNVVNNHVPLDPILEGAVLVRKSTPKTDVVRGELVPYTITFRNTLSATVPSFDLLDVVPPGFKYVSGSANLDGAPTPPVVLGRTLRWSGLVLAPSQERAVRMILAAGVGVGEGRFVNEAHARESSTGTVISNVGRAAVRVVPDPLFDGSDVIGKVFEDKNGNGRQDPGEPGIPGVRLITARGLVITTDEFGRYHVVEPVRKVSRSRGSNFVVKLDPRSLPTGFRLTTENPRVVRLTRGKVVRANFGVSLLRVVRLEVSRIAFKGGEVGPETAGKVRALVGTLDREPSLLRLVYVQTPGETDAMRENRRKDLEAAVRRAWKQEKRKHALSIEGDHMQVRIRNPAPRTGSRIPVPFRNVTAGDSSPQLAASAHENPLRTVSHALPGKDARELHAVAFVDHSLPQRPVRFLGHCNYAAVVQRSEIVIYSEQSTQPLATVQLDAHRRASWQPPAPRPPRLQFVYRVYDKAGAIDETARQPLSLLGAAQPMRGATVPPQEFGHSSLLKRGIRVSTRAVKVMGKGASKDHRVSIDGVAVPIAPDGTFEAVLHVPVTQKDAPVPVDVIDPHGRTVRMLARSVPVPGQQEQQQQKPQSKEGAGRRQARIRPTRSTPPNAARAPDSRPGDVPAFRVSVDGQRVTNQTADRSDDEAHRADVALRQVGIQVRYDGLTAEKLLNVSAAPSTARRGQPVLFQAYSNYLRWVQRAEIRIFTLGAAPTSQPLAILPLGTEGTTVWTPTAGHGSSVAYVLRVVGRDGTWDETVPKKLSIAQGVEGPVENAARTHDRLAGYGRSHLGTEGLKVRGGTATVHGSEVPAGARVRVFGQEVPVDPRGRFVCAQILSPGSHDVVVEILHADGRAVEYRRKIHVPDQDWFYVGLADLTLNAHDTDGLGGKLLSENGARKDVFLDGRLALYLKGKIKGDVLITAMVDTDEEPLEDLLKRIDDRDPRQLLRRLDPDLYYPIYGDDSKIEQDAPTNGKFYVRIEKGDSKVLWGNFTTRVLETDLAQIDRALYGAHFVWQSEGKTESGEARFKIEGFAAEPETVSAREEFRGTGGSLFYLRNHDLSIGSERVRVEVRDKDSGIVLAVKNLIPQEDYDLNYIQGRVILSKPLASVVDDGFVIRNAGLNGHPAYLIVRYEYRPDTATLDNLSLGGRSSAWLNEKVKVGVTANREEQLGSKHELYAADLTLRHSPNTFLELEVARSKGRGQGEQFSVDGGFGFAGKPDSASAGKSAWAYRAEGRVDLKEVVGLPGRTTFYFQRRQEGFSAPGKLTPSDADEWGGVFEADLLPETELMLKYDRREMQFGTRSKVGQAKLTQDLGSGWSASLGARYDDFDNDSGSPFTFESGRRTDLGLQVDFKSEGDWSAYVFGQGSVDRETTRRAMNRIGVGGKVRIHEKLEVGGEVSGGNTGLGARVSTEFALSDRTDLYLSYGLGTDSSEFGLGHRTGTLTGGMKHRFSDAVSIYGEENLRHGRGPSGLTHAFGVDLVPSERWTIGFGVENGELTDPLGGVVDRTSLSLSTGYHYEKVRIGSALEYRDEKLNGADRTTWLMRNNLSLELNPDWRALSKINVSLSDGAGGSYFDGDFVESSLGFAYRPVANDRWNWLFAYTYLSDLPSPGQVTRAGGVREFEQRSHVLSIDGTYELCETLSIGGKYAYRFGELRANRDQVGDWFSSTTQLAIVRADWHVIDSWDLHVEGRWHDIDVTRDRQFGALLGIYRHLGGHVRFGGGYNFTDFSDRLTDLSYDSHGFFLNVSAKF